MLPCDCRCNICGGILFLRLGTFWKLSNGKYYYSRTLETKCQEQNFDITPQRFVMVMGGNINFHNIAKVTPNLKSCCKDHTWTIQLSLLFSCEAQKCLVSSVTCQVSSVKFPFVISITINNFHNIAKVPPNLESHCKDHTWSMQLSLLFSCVGSKVKVSSVKCQVTLYHQYQPTTTSTTLSHNRSTFQFLFIPRCVSH